MSHKHAIKMLQYGNDAINHDKPWELWEFKGNFPSAKWNDCESNPNWCIMLSYKRKEKEYFRFVNVYKDSSVGITNPTEKMANATKSQNIERTGMLITTYQGKDFKRQEYKPLKN